MPNDYSPTRRRVVEHLAGSAQLSTLNVRNPAFAAECVRQSRTLRDDPQEAEILAMLDEIADRSGWS